MSNDQKVALEAWGFVLFAFGVSFGLHMPWILAPLGVLCIAAGNMKGPDNGVST